MRFLKGNPSIGYLTTRVAVSLELSHFTNRGNSMFLVLNRSAYSIIPVYGVFWISWSHRKSEGYP